MIHTNIDQLLKHIKNVNSNLFKTREFGNAAMRAGDAMQDGVKEVMDSRPNRLDLQQSYRLRRTINTQSADFVTSGSSIKIGFGEMNDLNRETKRGAQSGKFTINGVEKTIRLRPEPDLPSWIIIEFGRKGSLHKGTTVPSFIKKEISYSPRDKKTLMEGPSTSYHFKKPIFFMTNRQMLTQHGKAKPIKEYGKHPGIRESRIFRDGLKIAKPHIQDELGKGIQQSLEILARKFGAGG